MKKIIVVNQPEQWEFDLKDVEAVSPSDYLNSAKLASTKNIRVFNLSRDYGYQSRGYYVSLLAEARGHNPLPNVKSIIDMRGKTIVRVLSDELEELIQRSLKKIKANEFVLSIYFGKNVARQYDQLSAELHRHFQVPFMRARFSRRDGQWQIQSMKPISIKDINEDHLPLIQKFALLYFSKKRYAGPRENKFAYSIAILHDPDDSAPPSNPKALQRFAETAERMGIAAELITTADFNRLPAFDALFIRQNTEVLNATYRFATKAQADDLALIDYPQSILKCCNKVYMAELLQIANLPGPKTLIIQRENRALIESEVGFPCVIKSPDSTFSFGVKKAANAKEAEQILDKMFKQSDLLIAQEFCYTDFDWRIGILDEKPIYACKYFMAKGHWQIYNWSAKKKHEQDGMFECVPLENVPDMVLDVALRVAKKLGLGLYGVDVKEIDNKPLIIEINDCPNIDYGVEDEMLGDKLYETIISAFKTRIEKKHQIEIS